jgi:serine phosphatase RsbU (regulator of sigma subunit)
VLLKARIEASLEKKRLRDLQQAYMLQLDLENKRKSDELEQARQIQLSMLPAAPPRLPHLEIAADQKTASEVGGDYYDFFPQESGKLLATIGDATGHGVGPGLMVSMTKASLLATDQTDLLPLLNKINFILNETALSKQLNMALLLLELSAPVDGCVMARASGGGMPPIYVLRAGGALEEIMIAGLPLGIIHGVRYDLTEFCLSAGDVVLLMSDGLSEIFNAQRQFLGYNRMIAALKEIDPAQLTAVEILRQVEAIGTNWAQGHPLYDDVTLVVIRVLG